ncbi:L-threonylcarbamoyladenylate synthase [Candidatus Bealeia paramacronuclearis]|uniref:L-threonylcarbamoyladenylate synthase n=1 Tax=Candidatus Bealeia paramacronuclearis TaxID=1921001 RepID=UPI002F267891
MLSQRLLGSAIVALPTETVYGLAGLASSDQAIAAIYAQKKRPQFNPLIIHGYNLDLLKSHVIWNPWAEKLAEAFWPGPLTVVLPKNQNSNLSLLALAGLETVAIRMPQHPLMHAVLSKVGLLAAPSANPSGSISPTCAEDVEIAFHGALPVLDGGACIVGLESTILDLSGEAPQLLRPGGISLEDLENLLGPLTKGSPLAIKAPGQLETHYAPNLPLRMNVSVGQKNEAFLAFGPEYPEEQEGLLNLSPKGDLQEAASHLFAMMRKLDQSHYAGIAVAPIPHQGLGLAINDRLKRAAAPRG